MQTRPSLALEYFNSIKQVGDPFNFLAALVHSSPPTFECDWLDFKVGDDPAITNKTKLERDQKEIWSKALSAMANSGGGVLVWGINAKKDKATGVEAANALALVQDVHQFVSRLQELHRQATDPPILNVDYLPVPRSDADRSGFVACLIPDSPFKPHRAEYVEGKPFFVRAGDNSAPASVGLLRALFYPATNSLINLEVGVTWRVEERQAGDPTEKGPGVITFNQHGLVPPGTRLVTVVYNLDGAVQNVGTSTAKDLFMTLKEFPPDMELAPADGWVPTTHLDWRALTYVRPLHPGGIARAFKYERRMRLDPTPNQGIDDLPNLDGIKLIFSVYAADREPQHGVIDFNKDEIRLHRNKSTLGDLGYRHGLPEHWHRFGILSPQS